MSVRRRQSQRATVILTERALQDIRGIERLSAEHWGQKVATKYIDEIQAALDRLAENRDLLRPDSEFSRSLEFYRVRQHFLVEP